MRYFSMDLERCLSTSVVFFQLLNLVSCFSYSVPRDGQSSGRPGRSVFGERQPREARDFGDYSDLDPDWHENYSWDDWDSDDDSDDTPGYVIPVAVVCCVLAVIVLLVYLVKRGGCCRGNATTAYITSRRDMSAAQTTNGQTVHVPRERIPLNPASNAPSYPLTYPQPPTGQHYPAATQHYPPQPTSGPVYPPQPTSGPAYPPQPSSLQPSAPSHPSQPEDNAPPPYPAGAEGISPPPSYEEAKDMPQTTNPSETIPSAPSV